MERSRATRWERFRAFLHVTVLPNWKLGLFAVALAGLVLLGVRCQSAARPQPTVTREGRIVRFGLQDGKWSQRIVAVIAFPNGTSTQIRVRQAQVVNCRVGDRITYKQGPDGIQVDRCDLPPLEIRGRIPIS